MTTRSLSALAVFLLPACLWAQAGLKVNEVSTDVVDWIEVANLGTSPVNMTGYKIRFGGNSGLMFVQNVYTIPAGVTLNPNQVMVITEDVSAVQPAVPAGVFKAYCGATIPWNTTPAVGTNGCVALNDPADVGIDRVKWGNPLQDFSVYGSPFTGTLAPTAATFGRFVPTDSDTPADWVSAATALATPGLINPGEANVIDLEFSSPSGVGSLTVDVITIGPPVAFGEIFNLISLVDSNPDGSGPLFGVGADALLQAVTPASPGNPFHTNLDGSGHWQISVPAGSLPPGLHLEGVTVLFQGTITRISTVEVITL
jgi:Lamin Tail Domain